MRVQAELPGVSEKDIELSLTDDVLSIRAEKQQEKKEERHGTHFSERTYGTFQRSLRVPFPVSQDQVQANFENGLLTVTLPKAQPQDRSRRIQVQGTQPKGSIGQGAAAQGAAAQGGQNGTGAQAGSQQDGAGTAPASAI